MKKKKKDELTFPNNWKNFFSKSSFLQLEYTYYYALIDFEFLRQRIIFSFKREKKEKVFKFIFSISFLDLEKFFKKYHLNEGLIKHGAYGLLMVRQPCVLSRGCFYWSIPTKELSGGECSSQLDKLPSWRSRQVVATK